MATTDYKTLSAGDMLHAVGDDASKWADAFCQFNPDGPAWDVMVGWFANAIEHSTDVRTGRIHNGDHAQFLSERGDPFTGTDI